VELLDEARDLIGHENSRPALPDIQLRALRALVNELRARKRGASARGRRDAVTTEASATASESPERVPCGADAAPERQAAESAELRSHTAAERAARVAPAAPRPRVAETTPQLPHQASRHIPAAVRRDVFQRDGARCAYRDDRGARCRETFGLEIHHRRAYALGGQPTLGNLELRCRSHNALAAEEDFGREHMDRMRGAMTIPASETAS